MTAASLESLSDQELSAAFAREVAGWDERPHGLFWDPIANRSHIFPDSILHKKRSQMGLPSEPPFLISFATSADAVIPYLEKQQYRNATGKIDGCWQVAVGYSCGLNYNHYAIAPTFARAACIALIKAHRAVKAP